MTILFKKTTLLLSFFIATYAFQAFGMNTNTEHHAIFAHGLGGDASQGCCYQDFIGCPITGNDGPEWDQTIHGDNRGPQQSHLAQDGDIEVIVKQIEANAEKNLILLGVSKGAATMINTVGWLASNDVNTLNCIKAVVLDSPFTSPETVAANIVKKQTTNFLSPLDSWIAGGIGSSLGSSVDSSISRPLVTTIESKIYPNYDPAGITPIKAITEQWHAVDRDMVIVFVHSEEDSLITINDSRLLYHELKKMGFKNLYLIEASLGCHANAFWGPYGIFIKRYLCLIYRTHNLPLAELTYEEIHFQHSMTKEQQEFELQTLQPSLAQIRAKLYPYWPSWFYIS